MKNKKIILPIVTIFLAVGWLLAQNGRMGFAQHGHAAEDFYYCPMHPQYTSSRPGTCPICNMNLVKKEAPGALKEHSSDHSAVVVDAQKQQLMGLKTAPVGKKVLTRTIHTYGYVAHDLPLYEAQLVYMKAWRAYHFFPAVKNVDTQQDLIKAEYELRHYGLTDSQLADLQKVKYWQLNKTSPDLLFFSEGTWVYTHINENDLRFIDVGQKAVVSIPAYSETAEGIVRGVSLTVDPVTRTTLVRIQLPKYKGELKMNMYVDVDFPVEMDEGIVVFRDAILDTGLKKIVFVQIKEGVFEPRLIQTGFEGDGMVAVTSGLKEGETIVVSGNFLLDSESRLQSSLAGGHNHD